MIPRASKVITVACQCPSTSTAVVPCSHVAVTRRYRSSTPRFATLATSNQSSTSAASSILTSNPAFTTPFQWNKDGWSLMNQDKRWKSWIRNSRVETANAKAICSSTARSTKSPPSSTTSVASSSPTTIDEGREMIAHYLSTRSRTSSTRAQESSISEFTSRDYVFMLSTAKRLEMHLVENFLLADLATLHTVDDVATSAKAWPEWLDPTSVLSEITERGTCSKELTIAIPHVEDHYRIRATWRAFVDQGAVERQSSLALQFLHFVSTPTRQVELRLGLALEVLRDLISFGIVRERDVGIHSKVRQKRSRFTTLNIVCLRTLVDVAIERREYELAVKGLQSLDKIGSIEEIDIRLLNMLIASMIERINEKRLNSHNLHSNVLFELVHPLFLNLSRRWAPTLSTRTTELLDLYAIELIEYNRRDLLSNLYSRFSHLGWNVSSSPDVILDFSLFLKGEAPFRQYRYESNPTRKHDTPVRGIEVDLWNRYVSQIVKKIVESDIGSNWSNEHQDSFIRSLCHGRITDVDSAKAVYDYWALQKQDNFVLTQTTSLALSNQIFRHSSRPEEDAHPFIARIATSLIRSRTSTSSLQHYDLTTAAQLYLMMNDYQSVTAIYKRMLNDRVFPDRKDVEVLLELIVVDHWTRHKSSSFSPENDGFTQQIFEDLSKVKTTTSGEVWKRILRTIKKELELYPDVERQRIFTPAKFWKWREGIGRMSRRDHKELKEFMFPHRRTVVAASSSSSRLVLDEKLLLGGRFEELLPSSVHHQLSKTIRFGQSSKSMEIFRFAVFDNRLRSDSILRVVLSGHLKEWKKTSEDDKKEQMIVHVQEMLKDLLERRIDLVEEKETLILVIKTFRKGTGNEERHLRMAEEFVEVYREKMGGIDTEIKSSLNQFKGIVKRLEQNL